MEISWFIDLVDDSISNSSYLIQTNQYLAVSKKRIFSKKRLSVMKHDTWRWQQSKSVTAYCLLANACKEGYECTHPLFPHLLELIPNFT